MSTRERVLRTLEEKAGTHVSGEDIAQELGISRNSVWKAVTALRREGYQIDAVTNRGYALSDERGLLSASRIRAFLPPDTPLALSIRRKVDSTNAEALRRAADGAPEGTVIVAEEQTAGRGRRGRPFFSPAGTGIYLSIIVRPHLHADRAHFLTCTAALACAEAIEVCTGVEASIKWVNDVYCHGRKVTGILTEGSFDLEGGMLKTAMVGIGVNVRPPREGFPVDLAGKAGAILESTDAVTSSRKPACPPSSPSAHPTDSGTVPASTRPTTSLSPGSLAHAEQGQAAAFARASEVRCRLIAEILKRYWTSYQAITSDNPELAAASLSSLHERYRNRCFLLGKHVIAHVDGVRVRAKALDIDDSFRLVIELPDGHVRALSYGEATMDCR